MNDKVTSIRIAGIGGMGVLKASLLLAEVLFREGYDVKKAEVHGMSQRGGSISSDVRFGDNVLSPMIPKGDIDFLLLFQEDQFALYEDDLSAKTIILRIDQLELSQLENKKSLNVAMLGLLNQNLNIVEEKWFEVIHKLLPEKTHLINEKAFRIGCDALNKKEQ